MRNTCDKSTASPRPCRVRCWLLHTHTHTHLSYLCVSPLSLRQHGVRGAKTPPRAAAGGARGVADGRGALGGVSRSRRAAGRALWGASRCVTHEPRKKRKGALIHAYDTVQASGKRRHSARRARARCATPRPALTSRAWLCGRAAPALARNTLPPSAPADSPPVC